MWFWRSVLGCLTACLASCGTVAETPRFDPGQYCEGWTFCDTFDGDQGISLWVPKVEGSTARIDPSTVRANSGTTSLRAQRAGGNNDYAMYQLDALVTQCEYDVYVVDTFGSGTPSPELESAYFALYSNSYTSIESLQVIFTSAGVVGRWFADPNGQTRIGAQTPRFSLLETRNTWVHVALEMNIEGTLAKAATLSLGPDAANMESKTVIYTPSLEFFGHSFLVGLAYEDRAQVPIDLFVDNVRCR
jgi:hypothetical protein